MSSIFLQTMSFVLKHEGGFSDDPDDSGGATDFGISLRFLESLPDSDGDGWADGDLDQDGDVDVDDIKKLTMDIALGIYKAQFWDRYGYERIRGRLVAAKTMDLSVNMGPRNGHKILQRALAAHCDITVDGIIGAQTLDAVRSIPDSWILAEMCHEAAKFYKSLNQPKYTKGWLNRAYDMP